MVLTTKEPLSKDARTLLNGASRVYILGGTSAISAKVEEEVKAIASNVTRISGRTRYETSVNIATSSGVKGTYILTSGTSYPDALSASALLSKEKSPILLTATNALPQEVKNLLAKDSGAKVTVIGGGNVVSKSIENELTGLGLSVRRISGATRFETSQKVAEELGTVSRVIIASGRDFPDALSASALAIKEGAPILLSEPTGLPTNIKGFLAGRTSAISRVTLIGGTTPLSDRVVQDIRESLSDGAPAERLALKKGRHTVGSTIPAGYYDFSSVEGNVVSLYNGSTLLMRETLGVTGVPWLTFPLTSGMTVELSYDREVVLQPTLNEVRNDRLNTGLWMVGSHLEGGTRGFTSDTGSGSITIYNASGNVITERNLGSETVRLAISDGQMILISGTSGVRLD